MTAQLIDGKAIAQKVRDEVAERVAKRIAAGKSQPTLATVLVGDRPDSAAYVSSKGKACQELGMGSVSHHLPADATQEQVETVVKSSERFLNLATDRYKLGIDSYLNVITAQTTYLVNRQTLVNLRTQQTAATVQLVEAIGGGWDLRYHLGKEIAFCVCAQIAVGECSNQLRVGDR